MLAAGMLAQPPIEQLIAEVSASPESGGQTSDDKSPGPEAEQPNLCTLSLLNLWKSFFLNPLPGKSALSAPIRVDLDQSHARVQTRLWQSGVSSGLSAKFETSLLAVLGALALGATGYGIEAVVGFANKTPWSTP